MTTFSTQVSDALAAVEFVRKNLRRRVNYASIGLLGFSQGGLVASVAASMEPRVDSLCIWSAVASPPITYASLITIDSIREGVALPDGGSLDVGITVGDYYYGEITLGKGFFLDLFQVDPLVCIRDYEGPMMYVGGLKDIIVWPQPHAGRMFMNNHNGFEKLVMLNGDHEFDSDFGYEIYDQCLYWTAAWFIKTLE
jgi:pimeloyl-ACP methyl ester carboxylesterase